MVDKFITDLHQTAKPYAPTIPRRVAMPLVAKIQEELSRMEQMGVIMRVEEPMEWCTGIVVVPKYNGRVKIRKDLTKLNESVARK